MDVKSPAAADSISRPSSILSAPAQPSRVAVALRRAGIAVAGAGVTALTAAACVLSFEDLRALAIIGEARPNLSYLYPAAFDALLVIAMIGVLLLRGGRWPVRLQAGVILTLLIAAAATAEVTTALRATTAMDVRQTAVVVAVAPWAILIVALWLWLLLIKHAAARRAAIDEALADHEGDIVPFPDADRPTTEYPVQPGWTDRQSHPDPQVHPGRPARSAQRDEPVQREQRAHSAQPDEQAQREQPVYSDQHDEPVQHDQPVYSDQHDEPVQHDQLDRPVQHDRQASSVRPGQLVHHPAAEIMLDPQAAPPLESAPHHDLPASIPVVGPTPAPETPEVTEIPQAPPAKPMRWGDLVRPRQGDMLVHPPRTTPEAVHREEEPEPDSRIGEWVRTWDTDTDSPEEEQAAEVSDRDVDTQPIRAMADRTAGETTDEMPGGSSPDLAHGAEAADPEEELGSRERDIVAPPSGRMRSTPLPPAG